MKITVKYIAILFVLSIFSIGIFYFLNLNNRRAVEARTLELAESEGRTIEKVLGTASVYLLDKGEAHLIRFMDEIFSNDQVVYVAIKRSGSLLHAASKYEGYLPLDSEFQAVKTFSSPLGEIIEVASAMKDRSGQPYTAHIGYFFSAIGEIRNAAKKNFLLLTVLQASIILIIIAFLYGFSRQMLRKEMEIQRQKEEKEKFQEISLITAGINHEIRNPLNSLYLSYQMLEPLLDHANQEAVFHSNSLKREIKRVQGIIERFSNLSRVMPVRREEVDLEQFFVDMQNVWAGMAVRPEISHHHEPNMKVSTDRSLLTQIITNVVSNAAEAGASHIDIAITTQKGKTVFSIKDDGPGIRREHIKYIFDPFVTFKASGSGIGLALTKKMVLQLGGRIEVESTEDHGAEFRIYL
ncbi:MAG: HAMP domain-containing sensor histidine kinase [Candidatus Aminicenantes bacterium]|nr:HAMP domain-containing sensor histidine kinase [Candidatus Aminicenantes bacterium]